MAEGSSSNEDFATLLPSLPSPPLAPVINDDSREDIKLSVENWCGPTGSEPMSTTSGPPLQSLKRSTEFLSKEIKLDTTERENQRAEMTEEERVSAELKRKLSMESIDLQESKGKAKEQRCCPQISPPPSETGDVLWEREQGVRIGEGAYGRVFKKAGQAIKTPLNNLESRRALEREAGILESLSHPNIVAFQAFKEHKLYMELADGTLAYKSGCPGVRDVARELFTALDYIHGKGIIHGDLKPANLLHKNGSLRLCDFGQAKRGDESYTSIGSAGYAAPECLHLSPTQTFKSDIYSAGACLYYLMTGREPFQQHASKSAVQMILRIRAGFFRTENVQMDHDNPLQHGDTLLVEAVRKCMHKDAKQRPSAREVLELLNRGNK